MAGGRILYLFDGYPMEGNKFLVRDLGALARAGVPVVAMSTVMGPVETWDAELRSCPVEVTPLPRLRDPANDARVLASVLGSPVRAARAVRRFFQSLTGPRDRRALQLRRGFWLAAHARRLGVSLVHATFADVPALLAGVVETLTGIPYTLSVHGDDVLVPNPGLAGRLAGARAVFACSPVTAAAARRLGGRDVVEIRHPLPSSWGELPDVATRFARPRPPGSLRLLFAGRLAPIKGFDTMLAAFGAAVGRGLDAVLDVAGIGPDSSPLASLPPALAARVRAHGWVKDAGYRRLLGEADALVVPSRRSDDGNSDGIPNVVLEAFAAGLPVVASLAGSIDEALGGGERGAVLATTDERGRVAALADFLVGFDPRASGVVERAEAAQRWVRGSFFGTRPLAPMIERFQAVSRSH